MMYITEPGATVVALDAATGVQRWRFTPLPRGSSTSVAGSVNRWRRRSSDSTVYRRHPRRAPDCALHARYRLGCGGAVQGPPIHR